MTAIQNNSINFHWLLSSLVSISHDAGKKESMVYKRNTCTNKWLGRGRNNNLGTTYTLKKSLTYYTGASLGGKDLPANAGDTEHWDSIPGSGRSTEVGYGNPHQNVYLENSMNGGAWLVTVQFSSVALSCPVLCNPMDYSMPGLPVHHQLLEFTQTHVHRVGDTIQPSHPLLSPSPPTFNLSQHWGLFQWVSSSHQVARVLEFQPQPQSFQWIFRTDFL